MDVAILGSGAVGALLGAALTRAAVDTLLVTRETTAARLAGEPLRIESPRFGDYEVRVRAAPRLDEPAAVLLVAVKAPHMDAALERIDAPVAAVVPLLNGVEHLTRLREHFAARADVVAGVVRVQAHRAGLAHVVHRAPFLTVTIAQPGVPVLGDALERAGVDVIEGGSDAAVLWGKLARLAGLALATAAADAPLGEVRAEAEAVSAEVVAVANAEGAGLDGAAIRDELRGLPDSASSSLRTDIAAGRDDHELDAIAGAVLRVAARRGLQTPQTAALAARVAARGCGDTRPDGVIRAR